MTIGLSDRGPAICGVAVAVQQVEHGILRLGLGVEARRRVHVEVALVTDYFRLDKSDGEQRRGERRTTSHNWGVVPETSTVFCG